MGLYQIKVYDGRTSVDIEALTLEASFMFGVTYLICDKRLATYSPLHLPLLF